MNNCTKCGKKTDLPKTKWVKQEIVTNGDDEACLKTSVYCTNCVGEYEARA